MKKVSVILPVYNAEKTLRYCLDSILEQTYTNYEIIIINDGSKDNSQKIITEYIQNYPQKIRAFNQSNCGVGETRNRGIKYSKGKYIFFIDNDDYFENDYLEKFTNHIEQTGADVVIGGYKRVRKNGEIIYKKKITNHPWAKYLFIGAWAKVYRRSSLIRGNLQFLDINIGDDLFLNIQVNLKLKVISLDYYGYNWVYNPSSVSNTKHKGLNSSIDFIPLLEKIRVSMNDIKKTKEDISFVEYFFIKTCIYYILHSGRGTEYNNLRVESKKIFDWLKENYPNYKKNKHLCILKPRGETFSTRFVIYTYIILQKLNLDKIFLKIYCKI